MEPNTFITETLHIVGTNSECKYLIGQKLKNGNWQIAVQSLNYQSAASNLPVRVSTNLCSQVEVNLYGELSSIQTALFQFTTKSTAEYQHFINPTIIWHDVTQVDKEINIQFTNAFEKTKFEKNRFKVSILFLMRRIK